MKPANESAGLWTVLPPEMEALLERLEGLSLRPGFAVQRELALRRALRPYLELGPTAPLAPLPQEVQLATLYVIADFFPEDGQLSLTEQLRDVITEHIPNEERVWLDPLKHSTMDLLAVERREEASGTLLLRSLGDRREFAVRAREWTAAVGADRVLLTRLIRDPNEASEVYWIAGCAVVLSAEDALSLLEMTHEWRRDMEIAAGAFGLGEWAEFAKRYGHVLLWTYAQLRFAGLVEAVSEVRYRIPEGSPYLYGMALYDHNEYRFLATGMADIESFKAVGTVPDKGGDARPVRRWETTEERDGRSVVVARLTLTPTQLLVETDGRERLNHVKHRLAAAFGFSLHFRGESDKPPARAMSLDDLMKAEPAVVVVSPDDDRELVAAFLEHAYLEWPDKDCPVLGGLTPRHAAAQPAMRPKVAALIDEMERNDLGLRRTGRQAFEYDKLRTHVGLEEVRW